ncbi:phage major capsid protein, HK97 family [Caenispirillum bisanense]|uniref:Phage major capsid protein, HK97 family n=2 Tax=Caenispirillum bisanense TaxID=414052 RepID=A0A286GN99_9PROT|nr:phage major capsid protein, HK97 family [Caenispirillum bisanense]
MENENKTEAVADAKRNEIADIANHFGVSVEEFRKFVAAREQGTANEIRSTANIGLSTREAQSYSISRALEGLVDASKRGFEWEVSAAAASGKENTRGGLVIPMDVLSRTMSTAANAGGEFVPTVHGSLIDMLYANTVIKRLGATVFPAVAGTSFPVITSGANVGFVGELSTTAASTPGTDSRKTQLRTVDGTVRISRALLKQSRPSLDSWIQSHLAREIAVKIDHTVIEGSGTGDVPAGLLNKAGIPVHAIGANGGAITWADVVALESMVSHANAGFGSLGYLTNAKVVGAMKTTQKASGTGMIYEGGNLNGYTLASTSLVPADLTKGTGTNLSAMVFGNFADVYLAEFGSLEIVADPYTAMGTQEYVFRAFFDCDFVFAHDESFAVIKDIIA